MDTQSQRPIRPREWPGREPIRAAGWTFFSRPWLTSWPLSSGTLLGGKTITLKINSHPDKEETAAAKPI